MITKKRKPFGLYLLIFLITFLSIGGFYGGLGLILSPDGEFLQMSLNFLEGTPFTNYLIPGIILLIFMGIFPLLLIFPLIAKPDWKKANIFNIYKDMHWAWTYCLFSGIILVLWMDFQLMIIGLGHPIQIIYSFYGIALIIITMLPSVRKYYCLND